MGSNSTCHPNESRSIEVSRQDDDGGSEPSDDRASLCVGVISISSINAYASEPFIRASALTGPKKFMQKLLCRRSLGLSEDHGDHNNNPLASELTSRSGVVRQDPRI